MLQKITANTYYLINDDEKERPTLGVISGGNASLVVDAGNSSLHAQELISEVKRLRLPPIKYVVVTHAHWDHFLGVNEYEAHFIVSKKTNEKLQFWKSCSFSDEGLKEIDREMNVGSTFSEIIKTELNDRDTFQLKDADIIFDNQLTLDLGDMLCTIDEMDSTHTEDATVVYNPKEKVVFFGDATYGKTTESLFHYSHNKIDSMIQNAKKYQVNWSVLGHESVCDRDEMDLYWSELTSSSRAVHTSSLKGSIDTFRLNEGREPTDNEMFFIKAFINDIIIELKS
ncbi:MBL fold metallo-hydrolase [Virgibacillus sp. C22-A2]|uniref:MBL fold metallo-hydrolase n=1 Tax=Virgibacillus tibetensis TaxID=3042313 RepID=A0ABU6KMQ2_9BACI|nr:MBL fold metallo-hydrolase [Virgibacillus sp. C22-A2]